MEAGRPKGRKTVLKGAIFNTENLIATSSHYALITRPLRLKTKIPASRPEEVGALGTRHSEVARWVITAHFPRDGDICSTHSLYFLISSPCRSFSSPIPYPCLSFYIPLATNLSSVFLSMSISSSFSLPVVLFPSLSPYRFLFPFPHRFFLCLPSLSLSLSVCLLPPPSAFPSLLFSFSFHILSFYICDPLSRILFIRHSLRASKRKIALSLCE